MQFQRAPLSCCKPENYRRKDDCRRTQLDQGVFDWGDLSPLGYASEQIHFPTTYILARSDYVPWNRQLDDICRRVRSLYQTWWYILIYTARAGSFMLELALLFELIQMTSDSGDWITLGFEVGCPWSSYQILLIGNGQQSPMEHICFNMHGDHFTLANISYILRSEQRNNR